MQNHKFLLYITGFLLILLGQNAYADVSLLTISKNLMEPICVFTETVYSICYVIGMSLFVSSLAQYRTYRQSPNQTPLNRPIVLLILAILTASVPFIAQLSKAAKYTTGAYY